MNKRELANGEGRARAPEIDGRCPDGVPDRCIYFIQCGDDGPIKIGIAEDVEHRMMALQTGCPYELHLLETYCPYEGFDARLFEAQLHALFAQHRIVGEWFRPVDEIMDFIDNVCRLNDALVQLNLLDVPVSEDAIAPVRKVVIAAVEAHAALL